MAGKWTPEPWAWGWNGDTCAIWGVAIIIGAIGDDQKADRRRKEETAKRICAMSEALAGIPDPSAVGKVIEKARALVVALHLCKPTIDAAFVLRQAHGGGPVTTYGIELEALCSALAGLGGGGK